MPKVSTKKNTPKARKRAATPPLHLNVSVKPSTRKKTVPRSAYSKTNPSPNQFKPGQGSPNPGGKPRQFDHLLSRSLRVCLADRAPNAVAEQLNLNPGASWSQCLAHRLVHLAMRGDLTALQLIHAATEGSRTHVSFDPPDSADTPPIFELVFIESNGDGRPAPGVVIDAKPAGPLPALPVASE